MIQPLIQPTGKNSLTWAPRYSRMKKNNNNNNLKIINNNDVIYIQYFIHKIDFKLIEHLNKTMEVSVIRVRTQL